jgi:hypothetical protein
MDAAAARRQHLRVALAVIMASAGLGLAGCENSLSLFGSTNLATQETAVAPPPPAAPQPALAKVAVAPIIGAPDAIGKQIQQEFTSAIEKQRVTVAANKDERVDYTLRGYIVAAKDKNATKVSYIWDITDPSGKRVNRITGEEMVAGGASKDPWAAVTPAIAQSIAGKAANSFASWLPAHAAQGAIASGATTQPAGIGAPAVATGDTAAAKSRPAVALKQPPAQPSQPPAQTVATGPTPAVPAAGPTTGSIARDGQVVAVVPSVTGAPGDGSNSLSAAIRNELSSKGVTVTDKPTTLAYRVEGTVTVGQAREGKQPIQIEWLVRDPQGKKLGTVSQKNEIPEGSLDGAWGPTANQAAGAAAQGIVKLLPPKAAVN